MRLVALLLPLLLAACAYQADPSTDPLDSTASVETIEQQLQGTWSRTCKTLTTSVGAYYYVEKMAFAGVDSSFAIITQDFYYSDAACTLLQLVRQQSLQVNTISQNGSGYTYSATVVQQTYSPQTGSGAQNLNQISWCGQVGWAAGGTYDTTNTSCNSTNSMTDTLILTNGKLYRALDEIASPNVYSGTMVSGLPYTKTN